MKRTCKFHRPDLHTTCPGYIPGTCPAVRDGTVRQPADGSPEYRDEIRSPPFFQSLILERESGFFYA